MDLSFLPAVNAALNCVATALLLRGRWEIRRGRVDSHRRTMLAAFAVSSVFLVLYVLHKASRDFENTPFPGDGALRVLYLVILFSHVTLAMTVPFLALRLIQLGLAGRIEKHRRLARVAWPIWLYVSLTGVAIFALLYGFVPSSA